MNIGKIIGYAFITLVLVVAEQTASAQFALNTYDHIAFIGNALPDRMQHDGWLETYLQKANPDKQLVIRNLGLTGDQVASRPRNETFMSEHDHPTPVAADVTVTFFV